MRTRGGRGAAVVACVGIGWGLLAGTVPAAAPGAPLRPFALEDVVAFRSIDSLDVSPDGAVAAFAVGRFLLQENRRETHLFTVPIDGSAPARQITFAQGTDGSPKWSPDGRTLAFVSTRGGSKQVWGLPRGGGEAWPLTAPGRGVDDFAWSPDGRRLLVLASDPPGDEETRRVKAGEDGYLLGEDWRNDRIWIADLPAKRAGEAAPPPAPLRPLTDGRRHVLAGAAFSPDGRRILFVSAPTAEEDSLEEARAQIVEVSSGTVSDVPGGDRATSPAWSPDGRWIAFLRPFDGKGISRADLFLAPAVPATAPGAVPGGGGSADDAAARDVSAALDRDIEDFRFAADSKGIDLWFSEGTASALARVDLEGRSSFTPRRSWAPGMAIGLAQRAGAGWIFVRGDVPAEVWKAAPPKPGRALTAVNQDLAGVALPVTESVRWRGPAGPLEGVLIRPPGADRSRRLPLVLRPHGGPRLNTTLDVDPTMFYLASLGFLVLKPNFRGSTGYGDAFTRGNVGDWGDGPLADVMSGADELIRQGIADPDRLFWYGWSYSGYLANWAITHTDRLRAAVSGAGVADLRMQYILSDARRWRFDYFGGSPFTGHWEMYRKESPVTYAQDARVPTLFINGEKDERCPVQQSLMMYRALRDAGVETALLIHPREGHEYVEPRHILDRARRTALWFQKHDPPAPR